ncbi:MAG TPA: methyl-accepting chemotaxis protein, partial [Bacillota bacterium]
ANEVAKAMDDLAKGSMEQTEQINQAVLTVNRLAELVRKVTEDTGRITKASEQVAESAQLGKKASNDVTRGINELFDFTREVSGMINRLNDASGQISEITAMIENISEQTSLLALNASIEAARAGDYGKGFGVVARKTAKLAEESKQAAQDITGLIVQMRNQTEHAVEIMQKGINQAQSGKEAVDKAEQTFGSIFDSLSENLNRIREVATSAHLMGESNESVVNAITTIAAISEESSASTEEVSASTQQQTASIEEVIALADNLSQIAEDLKRSVAAFKLEEESQIG